MTHISSYIQAALFAALFFVFIGGDIGSAVLYTIGFIVTVSAAVMIFSRKHFTARLGELSGTANVGEEISFEVELKKTGFCFIPYIEICLETDSGEEIHLRGALMFGKEKTLRGSFTASHSGKNYLRLRKILARDIAGLVQLKIKAEGEAQKGVLPRIIEYSGPEIIPSVMPSDAEETEEGASVTRGGLPGYEHRDYIPGDSPRRVNYKLSAKKNKLMVRKDESAGFRATELFIADNAMPICCEKAFALGSILIMRGGTVKITHKNESWSASTPETLGRLREWLAFRDFADSPQAAFSPPPKECEVIFYGDGEITAL